MGHQKPAGLGAPRALGASVFPVRAGTGSAALAPPWSRDQVKWLGRGFYVLRLAAEETSRWLLGAGFRAADVLPHERTFRRSATDKTELLRTLRMNPWPSHMVADVDAETWRAGLATAVEGRSPVLDTGYLTLWCLPQLPPECVPPPPFLVLDGHHSRRAQINLGLNRLLGWLEPLGSSQLHVRSIERAGWLARWLEEQLASGELRRLEHGPPADQWTMEHSTAFEVVQASSRWWCEVAHPQKGEAVLDVLVRLAKGHVFLKTTSNFDEVLGWIERGEVDTGLRLPPPTKQYIRSRALARNLFPQKATYFYPKVPFGILVEDLR